MVVYYRSPGPGDGLRYFLLVQLKKEAPICFGEVGVTSDFLAHFIFPYLFAGNHLEDFIILWGTGTESKIYRESLP